MDVIAGAIADPGDTAFRHTARAQRRWHL